MLAIFTKIWAFLSSKAAEYIGIGLAAVGAWAAIRKSGEVAIELKEQANTLNEVKVRNEVENDISKLSDADVDKQLRPYYRD